jgi:hypothetical protein
LTLQTSVTDGFPYHIAVFLFNEAIVIFAVGTAPGELDIVLDTPVKNLVVYKLPAVVAVNAEHREWDGFSGKDDLFLDPPVGIIQKGADFSPSGAYIGEG